MRIESEAILWEGRFLRVLDLRFRGRDGALHGWEAYERPNVRGVVAIVPVTEERELVLIRQFRAPAGTMVWEVPAGLMDGDETPEDCARRELVEETGYMPGVLSPLVNGPSSPATSRTVLRVFLATGLTMVGRSGGDANEDISVHRFPLHEAFQAMADAAGRGEMVDLKVLGLIELAARSLGGP